MSEPTLGADETSAGLESTVATHPRGAPGEARRGSVIDRYVVLDLAGTGAMGVVLAAYDPKLDRKIAVKLLRLSGDAAHTRLQREAQALAKLDHPNVVTVYDVGTHEDQLFMAMEFVEGTTLGRWISEGPRPWREVVRVMREAGEGLAAAHAAGFVHRDFKPENVMISTDGRVRVMDFGLARTTSFEEEVGPEEPEPASASIPRALSQSLTKTGALMGTPAYMAPEQFEGRAATELSDQFSFCVALYQALYGERPFTGKSLGALFEAVAQGRINAAPRGSAVPIQLRKVVVRGLAAKPEQRWPSMRALLDALADDPARRRRNWAGGVLVGGLLGVAIWGMIGDRASMCEGFDRKLEGIWDGPRRTEIEAAMLGTNLSYAPGTWERVEPRLDAYARAWVAARTQACEATRRGEQSDELLDRRMACLDSHLSHLSATVELLARADTTAVESAVAAVDKLPRLDDCADSEALLTEQGMLPNLRVVALERRIIAARAIENLGKIDEALAAIEAVVAAAEPLDHPRLRVRTWQALGRLQQSAGNYEAAAATLERTYREAILVGMPDEAAIASRALIVVIGGARGLARPKDGRAWALHAEAFTRAAGTEEDYAHYEMNMGELDAMDGEYARAREHFERALTSFEALPAGELGVVAATSRLANAESFAGNFGEARRHYERALAILERTLDPTHPDIGRMYLSLGENARQQQRYAESGEYLESALRVFERALGDLHPLVGYTLGSLGYVEGWQGQHAEARIHLERAIELLEASVGVDHYYYIEANSKMGSVLYLAGDHGEAKQHYERARASMERTMGADHPSVGYVRLNLGEVAVAERDYEGALEHTAAALEILAPRLEANHPDLGLIAQIRSDALRGLGRADEATP